MSENENNTYTIEYLADNYHLFGSFSIEREAKFGAFAAGAVAVGETLRAGLIKSAAAGDSGYRIELLENGLTDDMKILIRTGALAAERLFYPGYPAPLSDEDLIEVKEMILCKFTSELCSGLSFSFAPATQHRKPSKRFSDTMDAAVEYELNQYIKVGTEIILRNRNFYDNVYRVLCWPGPQKLSSVRIADFRMDNPICIDKRWRYMI